MVNLCAIASMDIGKTGDRVWLILRCFFRVFTPKLRPKRSSIVQETSGLTRLWRRCDWVMKRPMSTLSYSSTLFLPPRSLILAVARGCFQQFIFHSTCSVIFDNVHVKIAILIFDENKVPIFSLGVLLELFQK